MKLGIMLVYRLAPGGRWKGEYYIADYEYFLGKSLRLHAPGQHFAYFKNLCPKLMLNKFGAPRVSKFGERRDNFLKNGTCLGLHCSSKRLEMCHSSDVCEGEKKISSPEG